jgi:hypothetical protein
VLLLLLVMLLMMLMMLMMIVDLPMMTSVLPLIRTKW